MTEAKAIKKQPYLLYSGWIAIVFNSLSIFGMVYNAFEFGLSTLFTSILDHYEAVLSALFFPIEIAFQCILDFLRQRFDWDVKLYEHWRHPMLIIGLYFFTDIRVSYISRSLPRMLTVSSIATALIVAPLAAIVSGLFPLGDTYNVAILAPILAFAVFEAAKCPALATYYRSPGQTWWGVFNYYFVFYSLADVILGLSVFFSFGAAFDLPADELGAATFVGFLMLLILRNMLMAALRPLFLKSNDPWLKRFLASGSLRTAINVLYALILFASYIVLNAQLVGG